MAKHKHNSLERKYLYHITQSKITDSVFSWQPRVNGKNRCDFEPKVSRICFSTSISGCFVTLGECLKQNLDVHVLKTMKPVHYYTPTPQEVLDAEITGEVWRLKPVKLQHVATLKSEDLCKNDIHIYDYLSFNAGIKDTLPWQKTAKSIVQNIIVNCNLQESI